MQTFSKTELAWIYDALQHRVSECNLHMQEVDPESPFHALYELRRDNLQSVMHKLHTALNNEDKRIAIK